MIVISLCCSDTRVSFGNEASTPLFVAVDFKGVDVNATSAENADVAFYANSQGRTSKLLNITTHVQENMLTSNISLDPSLSHKVNRIRGVIFISGTFRIDHSLTLSGGIDAGRLIYSGTHAFPYGVFGMLEPSRYTHTVTLRQNTLNIIPCKTIGASYEDFSLTPYLLYKPSKTNDTWIRPAFKNVRNILGLYVREYSPIIVSTETDIEGMYACVLDYETSHKETETISRLFYVKMQ